MRDAGIPADHQPGSGHQCGQPTKIKFAGQNAFCAEVGKPNYVEATRAFGH